MMNNENGRSMVEMLGVLAIIGVLSVAGIAGYTMAMRAYRANEILQAASLTYAAAMAQNGGNGASADVGYDDLFGVDAPGGATITFKHASDSVEVTTQAGDCDAVRNKVGTGGVMTAGACNGNTVTLTFS